MIYKNQYSGKESPLKYFDAIFYIHERNSENSALSFIDEYFETNYVVLNMAIIENELGELDFLKTKKVIFNKAKRLGFQKVLIIKDFPEEVVTTLMPHLASIIQHMKEEKWRFWHIELLTENRLKSSFSEESFRESEACFSIAFDTDKLSASFFD